ncbi:MAG: hypothetical protein JO276_06225 [Sphingomonadaceae bacterium]|nr:hypothetical protein [Sphingomonadaceae bacterium]
MLLSLPLLLAGCGQVYWNEPEPPPASNLEAAERARIDADPCARRESWHGIESVAMRPFNECLDLLPAEVMHGVWFTGFEESGYVDGVDTVALRREIDSRSRNPEFETWLDIDDRAALSRLGLPRRSLRSRAIAIMFVGRRQRTPPQPDADGHAPLAVVVVDAVLSGRLLGYVTTRICVHDRPCRDLE